MNDPYHTLHSAKMSSAILFCAHQRHSKKVMIKNHFGSLKFDLNSIICKLKSTIIIYNLSFTCIFLFSHLLSFPALSSSPLLSSPPLPSSRVCPPLLLLFCPRPYPMLSPPFLSCPVFPPLFPPLFLGPL